MNETKDIPESGKDYRQIMKRGEVLKNLLMR